jgi:hypothetical protein
MHTVCRKMDGSHSQPGLCGQHENLHLAENRIPVYGLSIPHPVQYRLLSVILPQTSECWRTQEECQLPRFVRSLSLLQQNDKSERTEC